MCWEKTKTRGTGLCCACSTCFIIFISACFGQDSDSEDDAAVKKVDGGLYKVQQISELRVRAAASVKFAHRKALEIYHVGLFDAALREPPFGCRRPTSDEVQQARLVLFVMFLVRLFFICVS